MIKKKYFLTIFFLLCFCAFPNTTFKSYFNQEEITISKKQINRLMNYFEHSYYSYQYNMNTKATPIVFAINKNGTKSLMIMCDHLMHATNCNANVEIVQTIKYQENKLNEKFKIIFYYETLYLNKEKIRIKNKNQLNNIINKNFKITNSKNNYFSDRLLPDKLDTCTPDC